MIKKLNEWLESYFDIDDIMDWEDNEDEEDDLIDTQIFCIDLKSILTNGKADIFELSIEDVGKNDRVIYNAFKTFVYPTNEKNNRVSKKYFLGHGSVIRLMKDNKPLTSGYYSIPNNIYFNNKCKKSDIDLLLKKEITSMKRSFSGKLRSRLRKLEILQREITQLQTGKNYINDLTLDKILKNKSE